MIKQNFFLFLWGGVSERYLNEFTYLYISANEGFKW